MNSVSQDLPQKVARLIGDFRSLHALAQAIEHEMEKRIVARHAWVKLDALPNLVSRLKNEYRRVFLNNDGRKVKDLEALIARLGKDLEQSPITRLRDAMAAHGLQLNLKQIDEDWRFLNATTFGVMESDLVQLDNELARISGAAHVAPHMISVDPAWPNAWRQHFGDPGVRRMVSIYPGIATADVVALIPTLNVAQDATMRAAGLATFMKQIWELIDVVPPGSEADRLLAEILLNDYLALWELLYVGHVQNDYGSVDKSLLDYWRDPKDVWIGRGALEQLGQNPHPQLDVWRTHRNKVTAHMDPDMPYQAMELSNWPMSSDDIILECRRFVREFARCAELDPRSGVIVKPPKAAPLLTELRRNEQQRRWKS